MKIFEQPDIQIREFAVEDIITSSNTGNGGGNATPIAPIS